MKIRAGCKTPVKGYKTHRDIPLRQSPTNFRLGIEAEISVSHMYFYILLYARIKHSLKRRMRRISSSVNLSVIFVILPSDFRYFRVFSTVKVIKKAVLDCRFSIFSRFKKLKIRIGAFGSTQTFNCPYQHA